MRIVCGLDVHKDSIFLCIMSSTGEIFEKKYGVLAGVVELFSLAVGHALG